MRAFVVAIAVSVLLPLLSACDGGGGGGGGSSSTSPTLEPELVNLAGNIKGTVITDANGEEFGITAKDRKLWEFEKGRELANTFVEENLKLFVNGVEEGIIVLAQEPVEGVSALADASEGDGVAVFGREDSGIVTFLDIETGTDANSEVTVVRDTAEIVTLVDTDLDDDGWDNTDDNCPIDRNEQQTDTDGDGEGDVCDDTPNGTNDDDSDGVLNDVDNCRSVYNPDQADFDGDGIGDVCDSGIGDSVIRDVNEWLQPADFVGYTFDQVNAVCPGGLCSGSLPGSTFDLTGYTWASIEEVSGLFNSYGVSPPFTAPFQERSHPSKEPFIEDFAITAVKCYGDCPVDISYVAGLVRDPAPSGVLPYDPYAAFDVEPRWPNIGFNNTSKDENEGVPFDTSERGIWFWRPVDGREWLQPADFTYLSWNDINAVCPEGACAGTLNDHDMTGWTWASVDDVNALFNAYREAGRPILEDFTYTTTDLSTHILYAMLRDLPYKGIESDRIYFAAVDGNEPYNSDEELVGVAHFPTNPSSKGSYFGAWFWRSAQHPD